MKVALLYDMERWVLHSIADGVARNIDPSCNIEFTVQKAPRKAKDLRQLESGHDVIHFLSPWDYFPLGDVLRRPSVLTVHHIASELERRLLTLRTAPDVIVSTNQQARAKLAEIRQIDPSRIPVTPYGIDLETFTKRSNAKAIVCRELNLDPNLLLVGLAAKVTSNEDDRKGFDLTWKLVDRLGEIYNRNVRLLVFGPKGSSPGDWSPELIPPSVRDLVVLAGKHDSKSMSLQYSAMDFQLCLSRIEGGPYPVLEAMACETKTISTPVGSVIGLIEDGSNGFLVTQENYLDKVPQIVAKWRDAREESVLLGKRARNSVMKKHAWQVVADANNYTAIYNQATMNWSRRPMTDRLARDGRSLYCAVRGK